MGEVEHVVLSGRQVIAKFQAMSQYLTLTA